MKKRADVLLVEKGLVQSREKAKTYIIKGLVKYGDTYVKNPSELIEETSVLSVGDGTCPYVSRGGYKLEKALEEFSLDLTGKTCIDVGASTGGFTDCMLQNGASFVYAVDVGYGQFDWKLRNDARVCVFERTNARYLASEMFDKSIDFASVDVSFISLNLIFPVFNTIRISNAFSCVALIKPQFEAGRDKVGKKGVVRDKQVHFDVIKNVFDYAGAQGFFINALTYSPVKGPNGNIEFLCRMEKDKKTVIDDRYVKNIVESAHNTLV